MRAGLKFVLGELTVVLTLVVLTLVAVDGRPASAATVAPSSFSGPTGVAACGAHVWVTNVTGDSVTELNASDGTVAQVIGSGRGHFAEPMGVAANGADLWVANLSGNTVSELNCSHGSLVQTFTSGQLNSPVAVAVGHARVWVASQAHQSYGAGAVIPDSSSVNEYSIGKSPLTQSIAGSSANGLNGSSGVAISRGKAWVTNANGNSVTELNAATGHLVRTISGSAEAFNWPIGVAAHDGDVWIANLYGNSITEINASDGSLIRVITGDGLNGPNSLCVLGKHVWVTNLFGDSVTELDSGAGSLVRVVKQRADGFDAPMGVVASGSTV